MFLLSCTLPVRVRCLGSCRVVGLVTGGSRPVQSSPLPAAFRYLTSAPPKPTVTLDSLYSPTSHLIHPPSPHLPHNTFSLVAPFARLNLDRLFICLALWPSILLPFDNLQTFVGRSLFYPPGPVLVSQSPTPHVCRVTLSRLQLTRSSLMISKPPTVHL